MSPADFRKSRKRLGYTQHGLAGALGMGKWGFQSVGKWERGENPIPRQIELAMLGLERGEGNG